MFSRTVTLRSIVSWCATAGLVTAVLGPLAGCTRAACGRGCDGADVCVDGACRTPCNAEDDCPRRNLCDNGLCVVMEEGTSTSSSSSGAVTGTSTAGSTSGSGSSRSTATSQTASSAGGSSNASMAASSSAAGSSQAQTTSQASSNASSQPTGITSSGAGPSSSAGSSAAASSSSAATSSSSSSLAPPSSSQMASSAAASSSSLAPVSSSALPSSSSCMPESAAQFCQRHNANCGVVLDVDNCGTSRNQVCGVCGGGEVCTPQKQCCTPETDAQLCTAAQAECGPITVVDGCLQSRSVSCGDCQGSGVCTNNACVASGWFFLGVGNSTYAGTTAYQTIGVVPANAVQLAIAVWAGEMEDLTVTGNQGNYSVSFQGTSACTRSNAPWPMPEGECFLQPTSASFLMDGNYPTAAITECAIRYEVGPRTVAFEDQSGTEDCAFAVFYRLP